MSDELEGTRNLSHWKRTSTASGYPPLRGHEIADVAVVGGGIAGLMTAYLLKERGLEVALLEARRVGEGTTGYSSAKLTSLHRLTYASIEDSVGSAGSRIYAEANEWAIREITRVVDRLRIDCQLERRTALTFTRDSEKVRLIDDEVEAARRAGLAVSRVDDSDLPFPIAAGVRLEGQASFHPLEYCHGVARAIDGDGSRIYEHSRVVAVDGEAGSITLRAGTGGTVKAPYVVLACGMPFLDTGAFFARMKPSRSYCVAMRGAVHIPDSMSISVGRPTVSIRPLNGPDGEAQLLISGAEHKVGQAEDTEDSYAFLEEFGRKHFGATEVAARWSSQDYLPIDGLPLIGPMSPSSGEIHVATGFRKWGLTMGTAAARILADRITGRKNPWGSLFDAGRSQMPDGLVEAAKEGLNDAKRFVGDRIRQATGPDLEDLAPGTGDVCRHQGNPVAAYRDHEGGLHTLSPVCTHLGCRVVWNRAEASWDCPCHGSRFSVRGDILNGPAVDPLKPLEGA